MLFHKHILCSLFLLLFAFPSKPTIAATPSQVMTISDSIVDYILFVDDLFIDHLPGKKGGSELVDHETFLKIVDTCPVNPKLVAGGSAVNTIKGLSQLGHTCTLIAKVGADAEGAFFLEKLQEKGVQLLVETVSSPTGKSACLVSSTGERTMRTYLGASCGNSQIDLDAIAFDTLSLFHVEGYQLQHAALVQKTLGLVKKAGAKVSMDLASFENVQKNRTLIWELLEKGSIDLLFANQDEASALTDLPPQEACALLANYCHTVVVTLGENGCVAQRGEEKIQCPALLVDAIDTTGAGDLFISGFLHGFLNGWTLRDSARMGTILASQVVQVVGAEIPFHYWEVIFKQMENSRVCLDEHEPCEEIAA